MDRLRPALLIAALVVDVGRRLPRGCGSAVPPSGRLLRVWAHPQYVSDTMGPHKASQC